MIENIDQEIKAALALRTWAIVGLSANEKRPAFGVARILQQHGHRIVPVHPKAETVHGERGYATLRDIPFPVDIVDCFIRSDLVGEQVDLAIEIGAKGVWLQLDVIDEDAIARANAAGLITVMNRCPAIEYGKLQG